MGLSRIHAPNFGGFMKLAHNSRQLLLIGNGFQIGLLRCGKSKGLFKVRNLAEIKRDGCELSPVHDHHFKTLKEAVSYSLTIKASA
jgi:hypothetical protein